MVEDKTIREFIGAIKEEPEIPSTTQTGVVSRIDEEGTVWVYLSGSDRETPTAANASEVKRGDAVNVEWRNNRLYISGNYTDPSAGSERVRAIQDSALQAAEAAGRALVAADSAESSAAIAKQTTDEINAYAETAGKTVTQILNDGETAGQSAQEAKDAAQAAQNSLKSVVQGATTVEKAVSVMQTALEAVVDYDPQNDTTTEYFWHDANGAHVLGTSGDYRNDVKSTGMEIVDTSTEEAVAKFGANTAQIGQNANGQTRVVISTDGMNVIQKTTGVDEELAHIAYGPFDNTDPSSTPVPYYTFGIRGGLINGSASVVEGSNNEAAGVASHAEGMDTSVWGNAAHAEGDSSSATGDYSHAQNLGTTASSSAQTALGKYNINDSVDTYAVIIGNGTADNARSNALTVDWSGNVEAAGDITDGSGNVLSELRKVQNTYGVLTTLSSSLSLTTSAQKVPLNTFTGSNCSKSSNGIKVTNAGVYEVSGSAYFQSGFTANDLAHLQIRVGSTTVVESVKRLSNASPYEILVVPAIIVTLNANDVVYLYAYNQSGARGTVASYTGNGLVLKRIA